MLADKLTKIKCILHTVDSACNITLILNMEQLGSKLIIRAVQAWKENVERGQNR